MSHQTKVFTIFILLLSGSVWGRNVQPKGAPFPLSVPGEFYMAPQWSPTGEQIAAAGPSYSGLYLIDFPSGRSKQLSDAYSAGYGFFWSHDGTEIAARISHFEKMLRTNTLVTINTGSGSLKELTPPLTRLSGTPRWSADDSYIFLTYTNGFKRFDVHPDKHQNSAVPEYYINNDQLHRFFPGQSNDDRLFTNLDHLTSYAVSPDGAWIAFSTSGQQLWIANSDGSNPRSLGSGIAPTWSPDSQWIVCMLTEDDGHTLLNSDLYLINPATATRQNISRTPDQLEMQPQWSPDGSWIVFDTEGRGQLFVQQMEWR